MELFRAESAEGAEVVADETGHTSGRDVAAAVVRESFEAQIPAGRLGSGAEAAEPALAPATGATGFLAGQIIPIAGGWAT